MVNFKDPKLDFGVISVYVPNKSKERASLWDQMTYILPNGNWIIARNFNMLLKVENSLGLLLLIKGDEKEDWTLLTSRFDLIDALSLLGRVIGSRLTKWQAHGNCFD